MIVFIISGVIGLFISLFLEIVVFSKGNEESKGSKKALKKISRIVFVWIVSTLFPLLAYNSVETLQILKKINVSENYFDARKKINCKDDIIAKEIFNIGWRDINENLINIGEKNKIYIGRKHISDIWKILLENATPGSDILATNCVVPADWKFDKTKNLGILTQEETIKRGITIKRILIVDSENSYQSNGQQEIFETLKKSLDTNYYKSSIKTLQEIQKGTFNNKFEIDKYLDVGIVKVSKRMEILFISDLAPDYTINGAWITTDSSEIKKVKKFYNEFWKELK